MATAINLVGQRFGTLYVVEQVDVPQIGTSAQWFCICDCGGASTCGMAAQGLVDAGSGTVG